jgi:hypothetical protein
MLPIQVKGHPRLFEMVVHIHAAAGTSLAVASDFFGCLDFGLGFDAFAFSASRPLRNRTRADESSQPVT